MKKENEHLKESPTQEDHEDPEGARTNAHNKKEIVQKNTAILFIFTNIFLH